MQSPVAAASRRILSPPRPPAPKRRRHSAKLGAGKRPQVSAATIQFFFPARSLSPLEPRLRKPSRVAKQAGGSENNRQDETCNANAPLPGLPLPQKRSIHPRRDAGCPDRVPRGAHIVAGECLSVRPLVSCNEISTTCSMNVNTYRNLRNHRG